MASNVIRPFDFSNAPKMIGKSIFNDPKIASLNDTLWRRYIEIFIVSDSSGNVPDIDTLAWILHIEDPMVLMDEIRELSRAGLIGYQDEVMSSTDLMGTDIRVVERNNDGNYGVYLIKSELGYYKIGYSSDVNRRFNDLNKASPDKLELVTVIRTKLYTKLEKVLHDRYDDKRYQGEWFELSEHDVASIKLMADEMTDIRKWEAANVNQ